MTHCSLRLTRTGLRQGLLVAVLLWLALGTVRVSPSYLAFFNELIGGPQYGYKFLSTADLDWGQGLRALSVYLRENGIAHVKLSYFGTDDPLHYGIVYEPLIPGHPTTGDIAVSVTSLVGTHTGCAKAFDWLQRYTPRAKVGYSIFVYHIPSTATLPPTLTLPECE